MSKIIAKVLHINSANHPITVHRKWWNESLITDWFFYLNKIQHQCVGRYIGKQNVYQQRFHGHFFSLGLVFGVQMACLLDFSFILAVTFKRVMCQNLSRATENQLNWRFVALHLEMWWVKWCIIYSSFLKRKAVGNIQFCSTKTDIF